MNRVRAVSVLVAALLVGGGLAYGTYSYLSSVPVKTVTVPTRPVVVAASDLGLGRALEAGDLAVLQWPEASAPAGAFADPAELVGRGLLVSVVRHEPLLAPRIASKEAGAGLPPIIPPGKRALSVKVNEVIGVAGYVLPKTFVDVLVTASPTTRPEDMTSKVVLTQIEVLTAGTRLEQDTPDGKPMQVTVVTLLVTPEEAERLTLASTEGRIQLALRNPLDPDAPSTPGVRPAVLLGNQRPVARPKAPGAPAPAPKPAPAPTIEVIRGDKREQAVVG